MEISLCLLDIGQLLSLAEFAPGPLVRTLQKIVCSTEQVWTLFSASHINSAVLALILFFHRRNSRVQIFILEVDKKKFVL